MNIKRIFGALLTVLGIVALIYAALQITTHRDGAYEIKLLVTFGILGLILFIGEGWCMNHIAERRKLS